MRPAIKDTIDRNMFDPDFEEAFLKHEKRIISSIKITRKDETELLHGEDAGMIFKYDLSTTENKKNQKPI